MHFKSCAFSQLDSRKWCWPYGSIIIHSKYYYYVLNGVRCVCICSIIRLKLKCYTDQNPPILNNSAGGIEIVSTYSGAFFIIHPSLSFFLFFLPSRSKAHDLEANSMKRNVVLLF